MVTKTRKQRGSRTHGWGAGKKHRGAGHRGGRGNAGSGKRGQQKQTYFLAKGIKTLGLRNLKGKPRVKVLNIKDLAKRLKNWETIGKTKKEKGILVVDLKKMGYNKLLGYGDAKEIKGKIKVIVDNISTTAREKLGLKEKTSEEVPKGEVR